MPLLTIHSKTFHPQGSKVPLGEKAFPTKNFYLYFCLFQKWPKNWGGRVSTWVWFLHCYTAFFLGLVGVKQGWVMGGQNVSNGSHQNWKPGSIKPACQLKSYPVERNMGTTMVDLTAMIWQRKRLENEERRKKDLERFLKRKEEQMKREEKRRGLEENLTGGEEEKRRRALMRKEAAERRRKNVDLIKYISIILILANIDPSSVSHPHHYRLP